MSNSIAHTTRKRNALTTRFPGLFVHGEDTLSQSQVVDYCKALGYSLRTGPDGALVACRNERKVLLPAARPRYSSDMSAKLMAELHPELTVVAERGAPGSLELELLLRAYRTIGLPLVGIGRRWAPFMPKICGSTHDAHTAADLDTDMEIVWKQRRVEGRSWFPRTMTAENHDEVAAMRARWSPRTEAGGKALKWRPSTHPAICMSASAAFRVGGVSEDGVGRYIEATDRRTVRKVVNLGDRAWKSQGAWPWAAVPGNATLAEWWQLDAVWFALERETRERMRQADDFLTGL